MPDTFTEVTSQSWWSRLGDSIKAVLVGIVMFLVSFPLLFWNEGRAVQTAKSQKEGAGARRSARTRRPCPPAAR